MGTPLAQVERCGLLGEKFLAIHANYLLPADIQALARSGSSVVHCPRSHAYFQHQRFPCEELAAAGVNVCLGTDSLASVCLRGGRKPELNLLAEMRQFAAAHPGVAPEALWKWPPGTGRGRWAGRAAPADFPRQLGGPDRHSLHRPRRSAGGGSPPCRRGGGFS